MKEVIKRDAITPYKELRKRSPLPFVAAGVAFLLYGSRLPIARLYDYLVAGVVAVIVYFVARGIWPDKKVRVELPPDTGDNKTDQLLTEARAILSTFKQANDRIADPTVSRCIEDIERASVTILTRLEEDTALFSQLRQFLRYYLPTTKKLLDARAAIEQHGILSENDKAVCDRCDRVLPEIKRAFDLQLEALDKHKYLDLQVEMDVLEGMLKSDGLSDMKKG